MTGTGVADRSVQRARAGRAPLDLAHVRAAIPEAHAGLQRIAAAARYAGRRFAGARAGGRRRRREIGPAPGRRWTRSIWAGGWRQRRYGRRLRCGCRKGRRRQRGCRDGRALGGRGGGGCRCRLGLRRRLRSGLLAARRCREGRQRAGCQRVRRCTFPCGRPCRCAAAAACVGSVGRTAMTRLAAIAARQSMREGCEHRTRPFPGVPPVHQRGDRGIPAITCLRGRRSSRPAMASLTGSADFLLRRRRSIQRRPLP